MYKIYDFNSYSYNREAFKNIQDIHEKISKINETDEYCPEELTRLYLKELNNSLFLCEPNNRYKLY